MSDKIPLKFSSVENFSKNKDGSVELEISALEFKNLCSWILSELSSQIAIADLSEKEKEQPPDLGNFDKMIG